MKGKLHKINIKDFKLSTTKKVEKALSHLNEKGELIKDKYYDVRPDEFESIDEYLKINNLERKKKRKKVKSKRCKCK